MNKENTEFCQRISELQQQWHGWGSPIGMGIGLISLSIFFYIIARTITLFI